MEITVRKFRSAFCFRIHFRNGWSSALDPRIPQSEKDRGKTAHSKLIIDACRPFAWIDQFPPTTALSRSEAIAIEEKWLPIIEGHS